MGQHYGYSGRNSRRYDERPRRHFSTPKIMEATRDGKCGRCGGRIELGQMIEWDGNTYVAKHLDLDICDAAGKAAAKAATDQLLQPRSQGPDISVLADGRYATGPDDNPTFFQVDNLTKADPRETRWSGWVFVKTIVGSGPAFSGRGGGRTNTRAGSQRPGTGHYQGAYGDQMAEILADPNRALVRYGQLTHTCPACHALLTDPASVARGIGPDCADKRGIAA